MSGRGLRLVTGALGVLAVATGTLAVAEGPAGMLDGQVTTPTVDSEVRFLGTYWLAYGVVTLVLAPRVAAAPAAPAYRGWLGVMAASGLARAVSFVVAGPPHPVMAAAMVVELVAPPVLWAWHRRVVSAAAGGRDPSPVAAAVAERR
ncbi:hypothetical protein GCM10020358_40540 [Amorphoplanes nipponensis]|uniref:DUF4345 domain-containing protein n=1 Tax=Actinoplanes nipponensis TaxID=135950 RepID=A0A919MFB6_9ACTN|nr:DUF4345 domain-containing protein [Actinoplanes nipponensis]GIE47359.1 hypothetical protein Ani05nite_08930 [Actinoplanes nipponensis]